MNVWTIVLLAGAASYALRVAPVATDRLRLPSELDDALGLVAPAAFTALAVTGLAMPVLATPTLDVTVPLLLAAIVAVLAVVRTGKPYASMLAGMPAFWLASLLPA